ncbi:hypothetical protein ACFLT7_08235, partial [candidate division KSB1 bacterium]
MRFYSILILLFSLGLMVCGKKADTARDHGDLQTARVSVAESDAEGPPQIVPYDTPPTIVRRVQPS